MALPAGPHEPTAHAADPLDLYRDYQWTRDPGLRDTIVERHVGVVWRLARALRPPR